MTPTPKITVSQGRLVAHGRTILTGVPENVALTHATGAAVVVDGAFVGSTAGEAKNQHVFPFGTLMGLRFMCCFRFRPWWMTQRMGTSGRDVPLETQFMLLESPGSDNGGGDVEDVYVVVLPLLEGQFRAVLQGTERDELEIRFESGDEAVRTDHGVRMVYMNAGTNPFDTINQAIKVAEKQLQTFHRRERKKLPSFVKWFGWCTWEAFYADITAQRVKQGVQSLVEGGTPPRFLIIDEGWQQIESENREEPNAFVKKGSKYTGRLVGIKENSKFQTPGLKQLVHEAKNEQNVKYVYMWHAMAGYWGGVKPAVAGMEQYESALVYPAPSPGVTGNQPDTAVRSLSVLGVGLVHPRRAHSFYGDMHSYLASCGIDGVKVDGQNILETLGAGHGGRVSLTRAYHEALEASVARSFPDNGCISCLCHNTDMLYSAKQTAVIRAADDFYPNDDAAHTVLVASAAYNTLFLGEFMQPDWDMFYSWHPAAELHGAARAIGGCPVYVSDKPGEHNFDLLKKLVLPDGSVLRAQLPGRPTRDCLFSDTARDGTSLLKIWNVNKCTGVVGVFHCQGAGWCRVAKKTRVHDATPRELTGSVSAKDVDAIAQIADADWDGEAVVYAHRSRELVRLHKGATLPVTLKAREFELFHVCPIKAVAPDVSFAPIGLLNMLNSGGAVEQCDVNVLGAAGDNDRDKAGTAAVVLRVRGCGRFGAYCSKKPVRCSLDSTEVEFSYGADTGLVAVDVPAPEQELYRWTLEVQV